MGEGVESEAEAQVLRRLGCDLLQGSHLPRPTPGWAAFDGRGKVMHSACT
ncbi:MAG: EAL domain-containing protein [Myxococcales bacterium]|nr:EAL domain-containing protein [Myxococcales bacterium]